jgi:hypothetical protein
MMYPELDAVGGLSNALNAEFSKLGSCLKSLATNSVAAMPSSYSWVERGKKFSQVYLAATEKLYLPDFWKEGVCLAHGQTPNVVDLAQALDWWLCKELSLQELVGAFPFIDPTAEAAVFEEGREIEFMWRRLQTDESRTELKAFVDVAIRDELLSRLFPFTSLFMLCFSRCTGYPYTYYTPTVTPLERSVLGEWAYEVRLPGNTVVGRGSATEALAMVKANLPPGIQPAIKGTAKHL